MAKHGTMQKVVMGTLAVMMVTSLLLAVVAFVAVPIAQARSVQPDAPCEWCRVIGQGWHCNVCPYPHGPDEQYRIIRCCDQCAGYCETYTEPMGCYWYSGCHYP